MNISSKRLFDFYDFFMQGQIGLSVVTLYIYHLFTWLYNLIALCLFLLFFFWCQSLQYTQRGFGALSSDAGVAPFLNSYKCSHLSLSLSPLSEDVCKRGFTVIIDMRGSKWDLIKPLLKTLQEAFPAEICVALIIKPDNFWQKQKTNFGSAKFTFEVLKNATEHQGSEDFK